MDQQTQIPKAFQEMIDLIKKSPLAEESIVMARLVESLVESKEFDLTEIRDLKNNNHKEMCLTVFSSCMEQGLTEEQRVEISKTIEPFASIGNAGTWH